MSRLKLYGVRLSEEVGKQYEEMASQLGLTPAEYIRDVLTNNLHTISLKSEVNRIEELVNGLDKNIKNSLEKFTHENRFNEKYYEDFGGIYMMMLGLLMQQKVDREDIRGMQAKGISYANANFKGKKE